MKYLITLVMALVCSTAGAAEYGNNVYQDSEVGRVQNVTIYTVVSIRPIKITAERSTMNTYGAPAMGAALGYQLGRQIGSGSGRTAAQVVLTALGAAGGDAVSRAMSQEDGALIILKDDQGRAMSVTTGLDSDVMSLARGDEVYLTQSWGRARVMKVY